MTTETKGNASFVGEMYNDPFCFLMFNQIAKFVHEARQNEMKLRQIESGEEPNDPSSPTPAQAGASPQPEGEKGVRCSAWLGDEETKLRNSIDQYMAEYIKRNLQSPQ